MFRRLPDTEGETVAFTIDGKPARGLAHDSVAAALLANGVDRCRTSIVTGEPRAPYCMMGICFECLVTIDGRPNPQACMTRLRPGMRVEVQAGRPEIVA